MKEDQCFLCGNRSIPSVVRLADHSSQELIDNIYGFTLLSAVQKASCYCVVLRVISKKHFSCIHVMCAPVCDQVIGGYI